MDKKSIIGLILIFGIFVGYMFWVAPSKEEMAERQRVYDSMVLANVEAQRLEDSILAEKARLDSLAAAGDTVLPCLRIYVNEHYDGDLYSLVYDRYMLQPYQSLDEYTHGLGLPKSGGIGYDGIYTNPSDGKDYRFLMTYFKDRKAMVELRLETTSDTFGEMEFEFRDLLGTLK